VISTSFAALGTTATVVVRGERGLDVARGLLERELDALDAACSRFRRDSELERANARAGERVAVGPVLAEAVRVALAAAAATGGIVTPALGAAVAAAGYDRTFRLVRERGSWTIHGVRPAADAWRAIELDVEAGLLLVPRGVQLDLGATAKALAADRAAVAIAERVGSALVSLGGDIAVAGESPPGGWVVRIADDHRAPLDSSGPTVAIVGGGLATSSVTVRRWRTDRGEAHHVIDPRTARPAATPWRTVSVTAGSCVDANVAALAALVLGDAAPAWLDARGLHARLVARDGAVIRVGAWPPEASEAA
jgi:thiamine biosynthesis lipoprotein